MEKTEYELQKEKEIQDALAPMVAEAMEYAYKDPNYYWAFYNRWTVFVMFLTKSAKKIAEEKDEVFETLKKRPEFQNKELVVSCFEEIFEYSDSSILFREDSSFIS